MLTLNQLQAWLAAHKNTGDWAKVANVSGVEYNTLSRIARGYMKSPSVVLVERISVAIAELDAAPTVPA